MIWTVVILVFIVGAWYAYEGRWDRRLFSEEPGKVCKNLRPRAAMELLRSRTDVQVLDVRSASEFAGGALKDAVNLSAGDPAFGERLAQLDKAKPVLVYCAGGYRSRKAVAVLREQGFESIHHLHRGYYSWRMAGLPTVKGRDIATSAQD